MKKIRRHDLDWIRVLVFGLLIIYHVGMFYVPWGWHIKNEATIGWFRWPMLFINQWRLPILFVVSGMGTWYALGFRSSGKYIGERLYRLGIPLVFGMLVIVPPQIFIERVVNEGYANDYLYYWMHDAFSGVYPTGNISWHHLWFLPYLLFYSLVLTPFFIRLKRGKLPGFQSWVNKIVERKWGLYFLVIPIYFFEAFMEPFFEVTHAFVGDWFALTLYGYLFLLGFVLLSAEKSWWKAVDEIKSTALAIGVAAFLTRVLIWSLVEDGIVVHFIEAIVTVVNGWSWILVIFGYGAQYLNRPSTTLSYANRAVYPFYILHQTITILVAYFLLKISLPLYVEVACLAVGTFLGSFLIYEFIVRRIRWIWPVMGLKTK